ncbi:uncharacterized protein LOC124891640 [Capsicum annuum]|uniref:uncharacterized protein LOC124891640 n=1 Tax=Capsicum annuum TaxID=4072 RepID=UPI001FB0D446|nr:uncharacterized protein LOC124891640 [Capsicum annuum]
MIPFFPHIYPNNKNIDLLYNHWKIQGMNQGVGPFYSVIRLRGLMEIPKAQILGLAGSMETVGAQILGLAGYMETAGGQMPNNIASSSQGSSPHTAEPSGLA